MNRHPTPLGNKVFQVSHGLDSVTLNMTPTTCTYKKWGLIGIPCLSCHSLSYLAETKR